MRHRLRYERGQEARATPAAAIGTWLNLSECRVECEWSRVSRLASVQGVGEFLRILTFTTTDESSWVACARETGARGYTGGRQ